MPLDIHDVIVSTWRWLAGLLIGSGLALVCALLIRQIRSASTYIVHVTSFFRALPILALVPVVARFIGIGEAAKISLIAWACFFPVFISTMRSTSRRIEDLELRISVSSMTARAMFQHYEFPRTLFGFLAGVEIALGIAWLTVVAAEYLGTFESGPFRGGLGNAVFVAFNNGDAEIGFLCLALFGLLGITTSIIWRFAAARLVRMSGFDPTSLTSE